MLLFRDQFIIYPKTTGAGQGHHFTWAIKILIESIEKFRNYFFLNAFNA